MSPSRHRGARKPLRRSVGKLAAPTALATCVTGAVVAVGLTAAGGAESPTVEPSRAAMKLEVGAGDAAGALGDRGDSVTPSRTARRVTLEPEPVARRYATDDLNVWAQPTDKSKRLGLVEEGKRVAITGQVVRGWAEVLISDRVRYVNGDYLSAKKPEEPEPSGGAGAAATGGISQAACADGSSIESGLTAGAVRMYRAVCAAFPALSVYGGWDNHGEHTSGRAIDFMTYGDSALGQAVAEWLRAHAGELNLYNVIWAQRIYTPERGAEGWRWMEDRGSATANHYDHVHASVNY